ncbi:MAG: acyltransferase family protein [Rickettsiales bacterium]
MQSLQHQGYRADIDGLRAVAVLAVLIFHANAEWLPGGFVGVDIFFVISGFLITGILLREMQGGHYSIRQFYIRRIRRIFPALIAVLLTTLVLGWFLLVPDEFKKLGHDIIAATGFYANVQFWQQAGYFDITAERKPLLHLWSLGVEEQFYILWPLIIGLCLRFRRALLPLMLAVTAISLGLALWRSAAHPTSSFYLPHTRFWELMLGGLLAYAEPWMTRRTLVGWKRELSACCGMLLIMLAAAMFTKLDAYPSWRALLPVVGTILLLATPGSFLHRHALSGRMMVGIGLISYPLYLWHWPLLAYARILYWQAPPTGVILGLVGLSFCLATLTYHCIEAPLRFGRFRRRAIGLLLVAMLAVALVATAITSTDGFKQLRENNARFRDLKGVHAFAETSMACPQSMDVGDNWCVTARGGPANAAVVGDSHAEALFAGLATRDTTRNWALIGHSSCPPLLQVRSHRVNMPDACLDATERMVDMLKTHPEIRTVVLASLGQFYFDHSVSPQHTGKDTSELWRLESTLASEASLSRSEVFYRGMDRTISALEASGKKIVLFIDVPTLDFMAADCLPRLGELSYRFGMAKPHCTTPQADALAQQKSYREIVRRLAAKHPSLRIFDSFTVLCNGTDCLAGTKDLLLYSDSHHLSIRGSEKMGDGLVAWLNASGDK